MWRSKHYFPIGWSQSVLKQTQIPESQNPGMLWVARDLWRSSSPMPNAGSPTEVTQEIYQIHSKNTMFAVRYHCILLKKKKKSKNILGRLCDKQYSVMWTHAVVNPMGKNSFKTVLDTIINRIMNRALLATIYTLRKVLFQHLQM